MDDNIHNRQPSEMRPATMKKSNVSTHSEGRRSSTSVTKKKCLSCNRKKLMSHLNHVSSLMIIAIFITSVVLMELGYIPPNQMGFFCQDPTISEKYISDSTTTIAFYVVDFLLPPLIICLVESNREDECVYLIWQWYREFLVGGSTTIFVVEMLKSISGQLAPHFLESCKPSGAQNCSKGTFISQYYCTTGDFNWKIVNASRAFPSLQASVSMFTSIYCASYLYNRFEHVTTGELWKPALLTFAIIWGPAVGVSRITSRHHRWWEVVCGFIIGMATATYTVVCLCKYFKDIKRQRMSMFSA